MPAISTHSVPSTEPAPSRQTVGAEAAAPSTDTGSTGGSAPLTAARRATISGQRWFRYTLPGATVAVIFACLSFTPSLLPRPGIFQGVVCGINAAIGYGLGVSGAYLWRMFADRPARSARRKTWLIFGVVGAGALLVSYLLGARWQLRLRELMQVAPDPVLGQLALPLFGAAVFVALVAGARGVRRFYRWISARLSAWMGQRAARGVGGILVAAVALLLVNGLLLDGVVTVMDRTFSALDSDTSDEATQPDSALRSGGPGSLIAWESLGFQGRNFAGRGPNAAKIADFTAHDALDPIRSYAGIESAPDAESRARLAVDDLVRAGGFDRDYVAVFGTTGTGWVDPGAVGSLEYLTGGNVASVAMQYSYLPSWLSFLVDQDRARAAGRALFDAVYEHWLALPSTDRPRLLAFGESLGSFSMDAAFSGEHDLRNRVYGAVFAGAPNFNPLLREFIDERDSPSTQLEPVFRNGRTVRFSDSPEEPPAPAAAPWDGSRILYLQHASDPISWWSPDLLLSRPDWLREPAGRDVLDEMSWIPVVTFWQITADLLEPVEVPSGHGHQFTREYVTAWATVLQPPDWSAERATELERIVLGDLRAG